VTVLSIHLWAKTQSSPASAVLMYHTIQARMCLGVGNPTCKLTHSTWGSRRIRGTQYYIQRAYGHHIGHLQEKSCIITMPFELLKHRKYPVVNALGRHVQWSVMRLGARVQTSVRVRPPSTKELFSIIPTHMVNREIILDRKKEGSRMSCIICDRCL